MIKSADVFMPCIKTKNKITVMPSDTVMDLLDQPVKQVVQDAFSDPASQAMLPNFTAQVDFASNTLA